MPDVVHSRPGRENEAREGVATVTPVWPDAAPIRPAALATLLRFLALADASTFPPSGLYP